MNHLPIHDFICRKSVVSELAGDEVIRAVPGLRNQILNYGREVAMPNHRVQYGFLNFSD